MPLASLGQKRVISRKPTNDVYYKRLIGKWRSEADKLWVIEFTKYKGISFYENDTAASDSFNYKLSRSCQLKDSLVRQDYNDHIYLLFFYSQKGVFDECVDIENLDGKYLSWFNERVGKAFLFRKIK